MESHPHFFDWYTMDCDWGLPKTTAKQNDFPTAVEETTELLVNEDCPDCMAIRATAGGLV